MRILISLINTIMRLIRIIVFTHREQVVKDEPADNVDITDDAMPVITFIPAQAEVATKRATQQATILPASYLIIIDPGHGPATRGKRSPAFTDGSRFFEYEFNWDVGGRVTTMLATQHLANVINTVDEWVRRMGDAQAMGNALSFRVQVANEAWERHKALHGDRARAIYVSIHANAAPQPRHDAWVDGARGIETWYHFTSERSRKLALDVHSAVVNEAMPLMSTRDRGLKAYPDRTLYVLRNTAMPACLVECGFYTHPEEVRLLMDGNVREALATGIVTGIINHHNQSTKRHEVQV